MKKFLPVLTIVVLIAIIASVFVSMAKDKKMVVLHEGNKTQKPVDIKINHFQDTQCGMTITKLEHSAQAIGPSGKTWFFDDTGCMALWYKDITFKDDVKLWVYSKDSKKYVDGKKAWYDQITPTTMGYGFGAYENKKDTLISFNEMLLKMYKGENLTNPLTRKKLLGE